MLPERFRERVAAELGSDEACALCAALDGEAPVSVRLHPCKGSVPDGGERVPWCGQGYYLPRRPSFTLDPAFHGGCYYVQEAASQFVGHLLATADLDGKRLLDLCAAPGGKTTLYASMVGSGGLVVANEIDRRRAQVLADNVRKWGTGNMAVTVAEPARLAEFEGWFDAVAVDAPCSGEGMFRKDPASREQWSEGVVKMCAARQRDILRDAWRALRPGGWLLYSTCTFNRAEDEGVLEEFFAWAGDEVVAAEEVACDPEWGVVVGNVGPFQTFRFFPHRTKGEGFFASLARKAPDAGGRFVSPKSRRKVLNPVDRQERTELARWVTEPGRMVFAAAGETCYGYYAEQADAVRRLSERVAVIYSGVAMGQLFHGSLKPDPALAFFCGLNRDAVPVSRLNGEQTLRYLRREEAEAGEFAAGMNLVVWENVALGFAKRVGGRVNNLYPASLRIINK